MVDSTFASGGSFTSVVYGSIKDGNYDDAIKVLEGELHRFPRSRAALSLLGYCYYHKQDFSQAATVYEKLVKVCPDIEEYSIYLGQSLLKAGSYIDASRAVTKIDSSQYGQRLSMLQAAIKFEQGEIAACRTVLKSCLKDDPDAITAHASIGFEEGKWDEALSGYTNASNTIGFQPDLAYNIASCHYKMKEYDKAQDLVSEIIDRAKDSHPELSGAGAEASSSLALQDTKVIEAYNLKAAIEFDRKNTEAARAALNEMPTRRDEELDPVTLHNQGLILFDEDPSTGLQKLSFLLNCPPFPPETFGNLLLLYCKHGYHDLAADILAENSHLTYDFLSQELFEYLDATIMMTTSPDEAYKKFDALSKQHVQELKRLNKVATQTVESGKQKAGVLKDLEEALERYIPVLMAQAKIYWDNENFAAIESLFRQSADFCSENEVWMINVAHVYFMQQGTKFKEAIQHYDPLVKKSSEKGILEVQAIVLANLCVAYIMTNQNEHAEDIMRLIEKAEDRLGRTEPDRQVYHSCIVNLVIGTLYCEKGNFEFGISRICKSLEPTEKKLSPDTWFYTKRCFLAMAENISKQMLTLKDDTLVDIIVFLSTIEKHGERLSSTAGANMNRIADIDHDESSRTETVAFEARQLKLVFLKLME